jgi:hypothetical protein
MLLKDVDLPSLSQLDTAKSQHITSETYHLVLLCLLNEQNVSSDS